jgi:hypothetical protein
MTSRIPILVLGGSDPQPGAVPPGLSPDQMLTGFKGAKLLPWGRCLAAELMERIRRTDRFHEPLLIGPRRIYADLVNVPIVDVEGSLAATLQQAIEAIRGRYDMSEPVAVTTTDILPTAEEICRLLDEHYLPHQEALFWGQLVAAEPAALGVSSWKPSYFFRLDENSPPQNMYPGHLVIARPGALRLDLTIHFLRLAYRYRNRELHQRHVRMVVRSLGRLIQEDLKNLAACQLPILTVSIPYHALAAFFKCRRRKATVADFERAVAKGFLHRKHLSDTQGRPVVFSVSSTLAFAQDIDTAAEFNEFAQRGPGESPTAGD